MQIWLVADLVREKQVQLEAGGDFDFGDFVILKGEKGELVLGKIASRAREVPGALIRSKLQIERRATKSEIAKYENGFADEKSRTQKAQKVAERLKLDIRFFGSRVNFDDKLISFFFRSDRPVDFRDLLKNLITQFPGKRLHLDRVGAREKCRMIGGVGSCGRVEDCCQFWKYNSEVPVPLDAVRDQGVMVYANPKIYGQHGKVKSCFLHEWDLYKSRRKFLPHLKQTVKVGQKEGRVIGNDILNLKVKVAFEGEGTQTFDLSELEWKNKPKSEQIEPELKIEKLQIDLQKSGID